MSYVLLKSMSLSDFGTMIVNCSIAFAIIFFILYFFHFCAGSKKTVENGGIKGIYPNVIKYLMQRYPNAQVTACNLVYMVIESVDMTNDVTMKFSLKLNPESRTLYITGKIIPGNTKWAWIPPKEYNWKLQKLSDTQLDQMRENKILEKINNDMVFDPER